MVARFTVAALAAAVVGSSAMAAPIVLISIDGLHPDYVTEADSHGLAIPHLRSFVADGAYARGVVGVLPTVTFPSHTTLVTGVSPADHGIASNTPFDPLNLNRDGWYWYAEDVRVPTLWQRAKESGLRTASVNWSATVGDRSIDYLIPEMWRAVNDEDVKLLRALARPEGLVERLEKELGSYVNGYEDTVEADRVRTDFALAILREHRPDLTAVHLIALDGVEHRDGPYVPSVLAALEALDTMIGELGVAALANSPDAIVAVVSDHGFIATHTAVNLRVPFVAAGLISLAGPVRAGVAPTVAAWDAQFWPAAASAAVVLRDRADGQLRARVAALLAELAAKPAHGIARVLEREAISRGRGFPDADFVVEFAPGFYFGTAAHGDLLVPATSKGTHGYFPDREEMHAALFLKGRGIQRRDLGVIDMRQIAPTLAALLGVEAPNAGVEALRP